MQPEIRVLPTPADLASELATRTADALRRVLATRARASLCLTGGSTPVPAYRQLAEMDDIAWDSVHVFWGDERAVGPDHEDSNYRMACETLLDAAHVPDSNRHRIEGERGAAEAARRYEQTLYEFFGDDRVHFDVLHLGMGGDGHTASLFPGSPALDETDRWVVATLSPPTSPVLHRVTLTFPALSQSSLTLIAAQGKSKRDAFSEVLAAYDANQEPQTPPPPVSRVRPEEEWMWLIDRELADGSM